jgi:hypothetical protein
MTGECQRNDIDPVALGSSAHTPALNPTSTTGLRLEPVKVKKTYRLASKPSCLDWHVHKVVGRLLNPFYRLAPISRDYRMLLGDILFY